jgi:hypothetical protein
VIKNISEIFCKDLWPHGELLVYHKIKPNRKREGLRVTYYAKGAEYCGIISTYSGECGACGKKLSTKLMLALRLEAFRKGLEI